MKIIEICKHHFVYTFLNISSFIDNDDFYKEIFFLKTELSVFSQK